MEKKRKIIIVDDVTWQHQFQNGERLGNCLDKKDFHDNDGNTTIMVEHTSTTIRNYFKDILNSSIPDNYVLMHSILEPIPEDIFKIHDSSEFDTIKKNSVPIYVYDEEKDHHILEFKSMIWMDNDEYRKAFNEKVEEVLNDK